VTFDHSSRLGTIQKLLLLVLILALAAVLLDMIPELGDKYRVIKDVQNLYRMARYQDPTLFVNDPQPGFVPLEVPVFGRPVILYPRSLGYGLIFYLPSLLVDYIWLIKGLGFGLMALCVIYLFKLGLFVGGKATALSLSLLFAFFILAADQSISIVTGLQRAFAVPLLIMFLYHMSREQYVGAALILFASTLFYFPNFPLLVVTYGLTLVRFQRPWRVSLDFTPAKWRPLLGGLLLSGLVVGLAVIVEYDWWPRGIHGPVPAQEPAATSAAVETPSEAGPFYYSQGYAPLFFGPLLGRAGILDSGVDVINLVVLLLFGILIYKTIGWPAVQRLPGVFWRLLAAGGILYVASTFAIFGLSSLALYFPSRYTRSSSFVVALCFVGLNWPEFLRRFPGWMR